VSGTIRPSDWHFKRWSLIDRFNRCIAASGVPGQHQSSLADWHSSSYISERLLNTETCRWAVKRMNVSSEATRDGWLARLTGSYGSDAEIRSRWKLSFTNDRFMGSVNGGSGRPADCQVSARPSALRRKRSYMAKGSTNCYGRAPAPPRCRHLHRRRCEGRCGVGLLSALRIRATAGDAGSAAAARQVVHVTEASYWGYFSRAPA
jgi:hypothetical protein